MYEILVESSASLSLLVGYLCLRVSSCSCKCLLGLQSLMMMMIRQISLLEPGERCHPYSGFVETGHTQGISQHQDAVNPTHAPEQLSNKLSEINPLLRDEVESQFTTVPAMKNITKDDK